MASYPLPPWLSPSAAQGWGELAQRGAQIGLQNDMERARLGQQAQQFAVETQQKAQQIAADHAAQQQELAYQHQVEQTKMQVEQEYKKQQLGLETSAEQRAQQMWQAKVQDAANKSAAQQAFQKGMIPKEQGGEGLSAQQSALKYLAQTMTGTEVGRLAAIQNNFTPGKVVPIPNAQNEQLVQVGPNRWEKSATVPKGITDPPTVVPIPGKDGKDIGYYVINPSTGKWDLIRPQKMTAAEEEAAAVAKRKAELSAGKTNAPSTTVDAALNKAAQEPTRKAQGGYRKGIVYGKDMLYLGGDPKDEDSWKQVAPMAQEENMPQP